MNFVNFHLNQQVFYSVGYVPDTDSEVGTVTMNSPTEWSDRKTDDHKVTDLDQAYAETFKHYQSGRVVILTMD